MQIEFKVIGQPRPAGSKNSFPLRRKDGSVVQKNGRIITNTVDSSGENGRNWRADVRAAAQAVHKGPPLSGPIGLAITFKFQRPKSHYTTLGVLRKSAPARKVSKPDLTKLVRSVEDALKGIVWRDDSQVVVQATEKDWTDEPSHAWVVISEVEGKQ